MDGFSMVWTPNLGPMSSNDKACRAWRDGWLHQRDVLITTWEEVVGGERLHEGVEGDAEGSGAEGSGSGAGEGSGDPPGP